jgi:acetyltransferase-like isoleucine patch superfamily enzyme
VVISGHVNIGQRSFIGVNATVRDFVSIGEDSFVGMSSVVTKDLSPGSVVLPARSEVIRGEDPKAKRIIQTSFGNLED